MEKATRFIHPPSDFSLKLVRKIKVPFIRKWFLKYFFKKNGVFLQDIITYDNGKFFLYKVDNIFIPDESLYWPVSFETKLKKCKNESLFAYQPHNGDTIIDIGAGLGEETILFSKLVGDKGRVIAIEANPSVFKILKKVIELNHLKNVYAFNLAIYEKDAMVSLVDAYASYDAVFIKKDVYDKENSVKGVRFDTFLKEQQIDRIDFLKVNIEGGEKFVIDTISTHQLNKIPHIAIACHDFRYRKERNDFFRTKDYVTQQLLKNSFDVSQSRQTGIDYIDDWVYAKKNSREHRVYRE
jgi:FkbM family methyltransferase